VGNKEEKGQRNGKMGLESKPAEITVIKASEDVKIMAFNEGFLDLSVCEAIEHAFEENNKEGMRWLFDISHLSFLDSEGIKAILVCFSKIMNGKGLGTIVCDDSSRSYRVFSLLGLTKSPIKFHNDIQEGLRYLQ